MEDFKIHRVNMTFKGFNFNIQFMVGTMPKVAYGSRSIPFKWLWCLDLLKQRVIRIFLWVKLYFLPIEFWKKEIFRVTNYKLGIFIKTYMVAMNSSNWVVVKISVKIDLMEGILEGISFVVGDKEFWKFLDVTLNCS